MKQHIAHINNTANLPYTIAEEQRKRGHEVTVFNLTPSYKYWSGNVLAPWARCLVNWDDFDVVFAHSCGVLPRFFETVVGQSNVLYWHHGSDVRGKQCKLPLKPHLVSNLDLVKCCEGSAYVPYALDLDYWKSKQKGEGLLNLDRISNVKWDEMRDYIDGYERVTQSKIKDNEGRSISAYSTTAAQSMALNKPIQLKGVDWSLYPEQPDFEQPRKFAEKYHDVRKVVDFLESFCRTKGMEVFTRRFF